MRLGRFLGLLLFLLIGAAAMVWLTEKGPSPPAAGRTLELFVGAASQPPVEEAVQAFEALAGIRCILHIGSSGKMLSELMVARRGDLYFPGSSDYMEKAVREGVVRPETVRTVVYLLPAINVPKGNPKGVRSLEDLARPDVRVGIARPDTVCVGLYGVEVLEKNGLAERVRPRISVYAESCAKLAQSVSLGLVDAALGWEVFAHWDSEHIETVFLPPQQVPRIGFIPIGITTFAREPEVAQAFIEFLTGPQGKDIFRRWGYLTSLEEARRHVLPNTPVGGDWPLPKGWP